MTITALGTLAERAIKWSAATTAARFVLQFGAQVALARLLGPDNYGVYGIGLAVLTFVGFLSGASFSWNLMLLPRIDDKDIRFSFTLQTLAGAACAVAMYAAAPALAGFFGDPRVEGMVRLLSLAALLTSTSAVATCLLQRDLNFRAIGLIQLASYAVGYLAIGVPLALAGYGATALGIAAVAQAATVLVASYIARPHPLRPLFKHASGIEALATGRTVFATNTVNWLLNNLDRVLIARVLNAQAVGLYNVAYNLASIPSTLLLGALQPTLLAAGARLQDDRQALARSWRTAVSSVLVLAMPAAVVGALLAADLVHLLYGPAWAESAWVLALLFLCLPAWASWGVSTPVLWNTGRKHQESLLQLPLLAAALPAWWLAAPAGIRSVAIVSLVLLLARAAVIIVAALRALEQRWATVAAPVARGAALSVAAAAAVMGAQHLVAGVAVPGLALAAGSAGALSFAVLVLFGCPRLLGAETCQVVGRVLPSVSSAWPAPLPVVLPEGLHR